MIIFYYYKEDTCTLNWNNIVFSSSTIDDYMSTMIQKHMSRVSSSFMYSFYVQFDMGRVKRI